MDKEEKRLDEEIKRKKNWKRWGPYLSERQWSTVREDYSVDGDVWNYFPHEQARSRAYRWGEDGLLGITDRQCRLCFALALWNGEDPILKERLFGLTEKEGNHGEDVKEVYHYLDSTPTHSYMKALYKYPQKEFPYKQLVDENRTRGLNQREFELYDTQIFNDGKYFDIYIEYAKKDPEDILIKVTVYNRSNQGAKLHLLPTVWFRNTWTSGSFEGLGFKPKISVHSENLLELEHKTLGSYYFAYEKGAKEILFTENETNIMKLWEKPNASPYVKDAFHEYIISQNKEAVNPKKVGTKSAPWYLLNMQGREFVTLKFRLYKDKKVMKNPLGGDFEKIFAERKKEADLFYEDKIPSYLKEDEKKISRQAYAGLLWSKQFYHYIVKEWLDGDPYEPTPPEVRKLGRNHDWKHLFARDVISMPDKWEYPWFAAWDLAFHMIPFSKIDPDYAKKQMILFLREWYMHPSGQQPAYEFALSDVNPPVHAWGAWRVYKITGKKGKRDIKFLESVFQKQLINFTWWLNRKDIRGNNLFSGGFLGLDNIGVFNRSITLPPGVILEQADATAWMGFYCLTMLGISLELATYNPVYEDIASKFFEHFTRIADSMNEAGGCGLWDHEDHFYYDILNLHGKRVPLRTRSLVGLIPLIAVEILEVEKIQKLPGFAHRLNWFLKHRKDLEDTVTYCKFKIEKGNRLLAIPSKKRLLHILKYLLDEEEFLSPFGIRSLSKMHEKTPYIMHFQNQEHRVEYVPGESNSYLFGGNSNWRGPIWIPINFLIIEALERYGHFYGEELKVEFPTNSGKYLTLKEISEELRKRVQKLFLRDITGKRPYHGEDPYYTQDPHFEDLHLFHEYFHAETGRGLGASHQTGWTSLIAKLFENKKE